MHFNNLFSVAIGTLSQKNVLPVARRIFSENKSILTRGAYSRTNFLGQSLGKHKINENYSNLQDVHILKEAILAGGRDFLKGMNCYEPSAKYEVVNIWFNETESGDVQEIHNHYGYLLSGCYYVDIPPNSSKIRFHTPINRFIPPIFSNGQYRYTEFTADSWDFLPQDGDMLFWFSNLEHSVLKAEYEGIRRAVPFDISFTLEHA